MTKLKDQSKCIVIRNSLYRVNQTLEKEIKILKEHDLDELAIYLENIKEKNQREIEQVKKIQYRN